MKANPKSRSEGDATTTASEPARYEKDLYGWVEDQVVLLRANEVGSIDASHITRELAELGRSEFEKLVSAIRIVLVHLLKWDHQPQRRSRSWATTIREHRDRIDYVLRDNPSLKPRIPQATKDAYRFARRGAARETLMDEEAFAAACPYSWEDITMRPVLWDDEASRRERERGE
ncbi:DUF29 domain-containing protein [Rhodopseudomonas palustris]|uniref:DUF29 domain-containing protein n=1 Tax=Rhodopseudomonas palustris TaxID=1076 RepID=UPI002ACEF316|nr:DUF29 domain-containing protein [Rhodopseudomonas palustris]WQG98511.1 DUF29 domain-containing protein [Rhodopseudomonas palustris]